MKSYSDEDGPTKGYLFSFKTLAAATRNFQNCIGRGGLSSTYRGRLGYGMEIAVTKVSYKLNREEELLLKRLPLLQHRNVVKHLGYCIHGGEVFLVCEFLHQGSLSNFLFTKNKMGLDWKRRFDIISGVARGLLYIHEDFHTPIIHRDIKLSNILLDKNWVPKIAGFDLQIFLLEDETGVAPVAGTLGYIAPEYVMTGRISVKCDVFSFGVVVLELISGQKNLDLYRRDAYTHTLRDWAYELYKKNRILEFTDPTLEPYPAIEQIEMCIKIGLLCTQDDPSLRPTMLDVVVMLSKKPDTTLQEPTESRYRRISEIASLASSSHSFVCTIDAQEIDTVKEAEFRLKEPESVLAKSDPLSIVGSQYPQEGKWKRLIGIDSEAEGMSINAGPSEDQKMVEQIQWRGETAESIPHAFGVGDQPSQAGEEMENKLLNLAESEIRISLPTEPQRIIIPRSEGKPIERNLTKILECLRDANTRKIAILGKSGIGKTTLLRALKDMPEIKSMFDIIIWVTVARDFSSQKLDDKIAQQLLPYVHGTMYDEVAPRFLPDLSSTVSSQRISTKMFELLNGKKFLVLLDDVLWKLNMQIPYQYLLNGSKIIISTEFPDVCGSMATDLIIELDSLSREEAWEVFCEKMGEMVASPNIHPFATTMVKMCGGLPLLINLIGGALKNNNNVEVWMHALSQLQSSATTEIQGHTFVSKVLKYAYDQLDDNKKSCFLSCAIYAPGQKIYVDELIERWISEGFIIGNFTNARHKGLDILKDLVEASLLVFVDDKISVEMHDIVWNQAIQIMYNEGREIFLRRDPKRITHPLLECKGLLSRIGIGVTEPPEEEWEKSEWIFLMDNQVSMLPERPRCPRLLLLFLQRNNRLRMIPISFFDHMSSLQILNLSNTRIKTLPPSISKLVNLQELILCDCERLVVLPSEVGQLRQLKVLDLQGTHIESLPNEIGELTCLQYLQVSFCVDSNYSKNLDVSPQMIPRGIISRLLLLKDLSIAVDAEDLRWNRSVEEVTKEMSSLNELTHLQFYFPDVKLLKCFMQLNQSWKHQWLRKFNFIVGEDVKRIIRRVPVDIEFKYQQQDRCLRFVNGESETFPYEILQVLSRSTAFYLDHHLNVQSLSEFKVQNLNYLQCCILSECPQIETILDTTEAIRESALPVLKCLCIHNMWNLTSICKGIVPHGSFAQLKHLALHSCPKLCYIFGSSILQHLSNLEQLVVEDCAVVKEIITEEEIVNCDTILLPRLKRLSLHYLPELVSICQGTLHSLEQISFYYCPKFRNLSAGIHFTDTIKEIKGEKAWWDALHWEETAPFSRLQPFFIPICADDV
ncbi:PREDICTED: disease resistance protein At4g27190-like isoform X2 [Nelumbo nucifera]|nr:PREDICTED: disease resistance protein At4g27190-like isoform X2 [Nelumbo nucifera]